MADEFALPIIYSTHPRSLKRIRENNIDFHPLVKNLNPFGFFDYNKLQKESYCVVSDSGTLSEESSILKFPAVLFRTSTERPEVLDKGNIVIGGIKTGDVINSIYLSQHYPKNILPIDYRDANVSSKVVKIIQSYYNTVNREIWKK
jgi:UDP-N-acetylglucosamine 2-epimerase (non-hydrolysing)